MKILYAVLTFTLLLGSCKKDINIDFERDFCDNKKEIEADDDINTEFAQNDSSAVIFVPNCFTPNEDGLNDTFTMEFRFDNGSNVGAFESFKVFNKQRKLVAESDYWGWDGKNNAGKTVDGEYAYEAIMKLTDDRLVTVKGHVLSNSATCIDDRYDLDCLTFPDQIHPNLGFIMSTQESISACQ